MNPFQLCLALLTALFVADIVTTHYVLQHGGYEANKLMRRLIDRWGFGGLVAYKGIVLIFVAYIHAMIPIWLWVVMIAAYIVIVFHNINVIRVIRRSEWR